MEDRMKIGIPVYHKVDLLDVTGPYEIFKWAKTYGADIDVELMAERAGEITTRDDFTFKVCTSFENVSVVDVLWVPGGDPQALNALMQETPCTYLDFLVRCAEDARFVASVCEGALLLAAAGLLDGYEATTHWAFIPCLLQRFPNVKVVDGHPRFHIDRNRITGGGISSGIDESLKLVELLGGTEIAQSVQQVTQYYPRPPVMSEIPSTVTCPL
jgi:transcriptional regulator GlxA family with amidase domain